jgi:O-antigen ligase
LRSSFSSRGLLCSVCALLGWSSWARGGTVVALQGPLPWIGLAIVVFLVLDRLGIRSQKSAVSSQKSEVGTVHSPLSTPDFPPSTVHLPPCSTHRPPWPGVASERSRPSTVFLFWAGLAFLALLTLQWWNAGRQPYFHPFEQRWVFTPAPHPGWPWAVERGEAAEMLRWFFPAWALMLAVRHARQAEWLAKRVAWFLVVNSGLLASFGIAQTLSGTHRIFWITPMSDHFFASFGYENHAASYFALLFALAAGLLLQRLGITGVRGQREVGGGRWKVESGKSEIGASVRPSCFAAHRSPPTGAPAHRRASIATASICAVLCLVGMALSFSRTGLALAVGLSGVVLFVAARLFWPRVSLAQRVAVAAALVMGVATFFFVVASMGGNPLAKEASGLYRANLAREVDGRLFMLRTASRIWADQPWFGVGGWGYRHFLPVYALGDAGKTLSLGDANAHNDAAQFLCEFGVVGFGLMLTATLALVWPLLRHIRRQITPGLALAGVGLLAVLFHSLIDLPFRNPGILYAWLAVAGLSDPALPVVRQGLPAAETLPKQADRWCRTRP